MKSHVRHRFISLLVLAAFLLALLAGASDPHAQDQATAPQGRKFWRPTFVPVGTEFVGSQACSECHKSRLSSQLQSSMGLAMEPAATAKILIANPQLQFRLGKYTWEVVRSGNQSLYSVTDGSATITVPVRYAFGQGKAGQTYVLEYKGDFYESRLSFYIDIKGLDFTLGVPRTEPDSLVAALGRPMSKDETLQCFSCHTTGAVIGTKLHLDKMMPGIGCESCHGPGGEHVAASQAGRPNKDKIFNPARLNADDMAQEFCGACHRSAEDILSKPSLYGLNNVRFQPYRIFNSKCYSDDRRISCTACHNVHEPGIETEAYYDAKCLACHQSSAKAAAPVTGQRTAPACRVDAKHCASCHMPKVDLPGAHFKFTDHRIRIAREGAPYPF
ncbi:MAG: multiheme c-type cytochrome [Blastocatellia bacterium]